MNKITQILAVVVVLTQVATAQMTMVGSFTGGDDLNVGPGTAGFSETLTQPYTVRSLGFFDASGTGLTNPHQVGVWDAQKNLLAWATIPAVGAARIGDTYFVNVTPITLQPGTYRWGASYIDVDADLARGNVPLSGVVMHPGVVLGDAYLSSGTGFQYPDFNVSGANAGLFGPNAADFAVVPEPSSMLVVAGILLALAVIRRRVTRAVLTK